ncbi:MAG: RsmB/NOP family class I SAM-dependent RNA methyltransferase [Erythrobacter sp.]
MAQPPGTHARRAALQMLDAVLRRGETLEQAEGAALKMLRTAPDKALARAIANESLRWLTDLDTLIDSATSQRLPDDAKARSVLRLMLAQWLRLGTPPHAVVATALPLLAGGPRRLAHGVFSTLTKNAASLPAAPTLPTVVAARWGDEAQAIARGLADPPPLDLTLRDGLRDPALTAQWAVRLGGETYASGHVRLSRGVAVEKIEGYRDGQWWVQDLAASLPVRLLAEGAGRHVLDLCAAPGGKTMQLAAMGWKVTALDLSKRRLDRLSDNLKRTGLKASLVRADALEWEPRHQFDAILLDAPCTATGTCRRHPDVLHRIGERQITEMVELQAALLDRATSWLKPGGVLVYAVCSLEAAEGELQAAAVSLEPMPITSDELPNGILPTPEGWLRTHPGLLTDRGGLDGFFVARWRR